MSGAIAGIAGVSEVAGIQNRLTGGLSPGYGYTGIVVATLGTLTMPGVAIAALFLGDLTVGASSAARSLGHPLAARRGRAGRPAADHRRAAGPAAQSARTHRTPAAPGSVTGDVAAEAQPG